MGSVRMYRPAPRMATAELKIYFRDVVDARGAKTETFQITPRPSATITIFTNSSQIHHNLPNSTELCPIHSNKARFHRNSIRFTLISKFFKKK